jgi:hypothetical protein
MFPHVAIRDGISGNVFVLFDEDGRPYLASMDRLRIYSAAHVFAEIATVH